MEHDEEKKMKYVLNSAQMQQCDKNTMEEGYGLPSAVLMERAALTAVEEIAARFPHRETRLCLVCGVGNNGGDGLAMARLLHQRGYSATVYFPGKEEKCSVEAARQLAIARRYGILITDTWPEGEFDVVVDAVFGIGLSRPVGGIYAQVVQEMNQAAGFKVAVDIPSGISADDGSVLGCAFRADLTVTFGFAKVGQLLFPGAAYCGELVVRDMGIDELSLFDLRPQVCRPEPEDLAALPGRRADTNKGSYGRLQVFAGCATMAGAAIFSASAAYRMGSGLVRVVTDVANRTAVYTRIPEAVLSVYDEDTDMAGLVRENLPWGDALVLGPGIGTTAAAEMMVGTILSGARVPCVVDADALNLLAQHPEWLEQKAEDVPLILTPHLGEMSRLTGMPIAKIKGDLLRVAGEYAARHGVILVLKDSRTVTALPDGRIFLNISGNNGMATAGSGDVLTGIIGALLGQGLSPEQAAPLGVYLHGLAGDEAAKARGKASMMATDLLEGLSRVMKQHEERENRG